MNSKWLLAGLLIVVLGILIAFQIESWQERRLERVNEISSLKSLVVDLNTDLERLQRTSMTYRFMGDAGKNLVDMLKYPGSKSAEKIAKLYLDATWETSYQAAVPTYSGLK